MLGTGFFSESMQRKLNQQVLDDVSNISTQVTPVERRGDFFVKRDDLWNEHDIAYGGKARTAGLICRDVIRRGGKGIVVAIARNSSVPCMLARVCKYYGLELHVHVPMGHLPTIFDQAKEYGAHVYQHPAGYMSVLK